MNFPKQVCAGVKKEGTQSGDALHSFRMDQAEPLTSVMQHWCYAGWESNCLVL